MQPLIRRQGQERTFQGVLVRHEGEGVTADRQVGLLPVDDATDDVARADRGRGRH